VLVESSSGSLGVALAIVCAERGYRFRCVVDPNTASQNLKMMKALGAEVTLVDVRDENGGFLGSRIAYIRQLVAQDPRHVWLNQYANPENPRAHARTTAASILATFPRVDWLFVGAGTTGTLMGCVQRFGQDSPHTRIVAVDTVGSVTFGTAPGKRHIPGLGTSRRPEIFDPAGVHAFELVPEAQTVAMCRWLARSNGILAGGSTGTVLAGVHRWRDRLSEDACVVAISPDFGERYLDSVYDDAWVCERFGTVPEFEPVAPGACAVADGVTA
jgi:cysteine synthase A